jgi:hypothetical protein
MEAVCSYKTLVSTHEPTRLYNPEDSHNTFTAVRTSELIRNYVTRKHRLKLEDNIKMCLEEIVWEDVDWINVAIDTILWRRALVNTVTNLRLS